MEGKIYTRAGDEGQTRLLSGRLVGKQELRVEAYGTADELNCALGLARALLGEAQSALAEPLRRVQTEVMTLASLLASDKPDQWERLPRLAQGAVARLEGEIDEMTDVLPPLDSFVVPGGTPSSAQLQVCRTICRRAERRAVALAAAMSVHAADPPGKSACSSNASGCAAAGRNPAPAPSCPDPDKAIAATTVCQPPASLKLDPVYTKYVSVDGLPIVATDHAEDRPAIEPPWHQFANQLDFYEPFERIREAIDEARSAA